MFCEFMPVVVLTYLVDIFHLSPSYYVALGIFYTRFINGPLNFQGRGWVTNVLFVAEHSNVSCSFSFFQSVVSKHGSLDRKSVLMHSEIHTNSDPRLFQPLTSH